jgi:hypothetical protein
MCPYLSSLMVQQIKCSTSMPILARGMVRQSISRVEKILEESGKFELDDFIDDWHLRRPFEDQ